MASTSSATQTVPSEATKDMIKIKIVFKKEVHEMSLESDKTVSHLKLKIQLVTSVAPDMQKLIHRGKPLKNNESTLAMCGIKNNDKILLIGCTLTDVTTILKPSPQTTPEVQRIPRGVPFCKQNKHMKLLEKGLPKDVMPGLKTGDEPIPPAGVKGLTDKYGKSCELSFRLEKDEFCVKWGEKSFNYSISEVDNIDHQTIDGHEEYSILLIQMRHKKDFWFYWIPHQYINSIRKAFT